MDVIGTLKGLLTDSGFAALMAEGGWQNLIMIVIACFLLYLGIKKKFEPLLLVGIAFGCLLVNISWFWTSFNGNADALFHQDLWDAFLDVNSPAYHSYGTIMAHGGLLDILYIGVKSGLYPCLIFMGVGAMTALLSLVQVRSALPAHRLPPLVLSAVRTARQRSSSRPSWHLNFWVRLRLPHTPTWR